MTSLILTTITSALQPLLLLYSIFLLLNGHDEPGGGFAGGLVAAAAFTLHTIAYDVAATRRALRFQPVQLIAVGLLIALASGLPSLGQGQAFLTSGWHTVELLALGTVKVGTPLVFDVGVYLVVLGVALIFVLSLAEH